MGGIPEGYEEIFTKPIYTDKDHYYDYGTLLPDERGPAPASAVPTPACDFRDDNCQKSSVDLPGDSSSTVKSETVAEKTGSNNNILSQKLSKDNIMKGITNIVDNYLPSSKYVEIEKNSKTSSGKKDKRVSLTACPLTSNFKDETFSKKIIYLLGSKKIDTYYGAEFYGFLRNSLGPSSGIIFPYTPSIDIQNVVNYDNISITHSNLNYNYYKNTTPPTYTCSAKFTADNKMNALHMLSAIWFFMACTKCDFGENAQNPGLPPPILYLNGYNNLLDNIPVIIESFSYKLPEEKQYVNLVVDMSKDIDADGISTYYTETTIKDYTNYKNSDLLKMYFTGNKGNPKITTFGGAMNLSYWLPMELSLSFKLKTQPNLLKVKKQWSLEKIKTGELMLQGESFRNPESSLPEELISDTKSEDMTLKFIPSGWTW